MHPLLKCVSAILVSLVAVAVMTWPAIECQAAKRHDPQAVYDAFNAFCLKSFGAEKEPLTYQAFGDALTVDKKSRWQYISEGSACIAWSTNLPAYGIVEYGMTRQLGMHTPKAERPFYTHIHYLKDLKPNTTYYYRLTGTDERGKTLRGPIQSFKTVLPAADRVVRIDQTHTAKAIELTKPGYYLLTTDLAADGTAFEIKASGVTLDLGGHTVTYDQKDWTEPASAGDFNAWFKQGPMGVRIPQYNLHDLRIVNGTIKQGAGGDGGQGNSVGANPIAAVSSNGTPPEIAGLTLQWYGEQITGMMLRGNANVHHNILLDMGTGLTNRHQGVCAIRSAAKPHHNLIKRTRQRGIDCANGGDVYANEIYIDSCATNSFGIFAYKTKKLDIHDNRIFGGGYLAIGIGNVSVGVRDVNVYNNFVHLQASAPSDAWSEYGKQSGAYCYRVTWGGENLDVHNNYFITYGRDRGMVRGVWFCPDTNQHHNRIHDNVIKAIVQNKASDLQGTIVISGHPESGIEPVLFEHNRIISNFLMVRLGEPYGAGSHSRFVNNTFERVGRLKRFRWVQIGFWTPACVDNTFIDPKFVGNVNAQQVRWEGDAKSDRRFDVGYALTLHAPDGAKVTVADATGKTVAQGTVKDGLFKADLIATHYANGSSQTVTPHSVTVSIDGRQSTRKVRMDQPIDLKW